MMTEGVFKQLMQDVMALKEARLSDDVGSLEWVRGLAVGLALLASSTDDLALGRVASALFSDCLEAQRLVALRAPMAPMAEA